MDSTVFTIIQDAAIGLVMLLTAIGGLAATKRKAHTDAPTVVSQWQELYQESKKEIARKNDELAAQHKRYDDLSIKHGKLLAAASESWKMPKALLEYQLSNGGLFDGGPPPEVRH